jgi:hypothetical protein
MMLVAGAIIFNKDSNDFVVAPIEEMLKRIRRIAMNPLEAAKIQEDNQIIEEEYFL